MKSILSLFLTLSLLLATLCTMSACKQDRTEIEPHTHTFGEEYNFDDVFHWRVCEDITCGEIVEEEHTLIDEECFCGYCEDPEESGDSDHNTGNDSPFVP